MGFRFNFMFHLQCHLLYNLYYSTAVFNLDKTNNECYQSLEYLQIRHDLVRYKKQCSKHVGQVQSL